MIEKVCVYCASSDKVAPTYFEGATSLGKILAQNNITTVFGGGSAGLMGRLADSALANGGKVIGIIPHFMKEVEWDHQGLTQLILVEDMHERKKRFLEHADALVALPGGCGTFEELLEAITLKRLGVFTNPIIIYNQNGYYDGLLALFDRAVEEHFMSEKHKEIWSVIDNLDDLLPAIANAPKWDKSAIKFAKV